MSEEWIEDEFTQWTGEEWLPYEPEVLNRETQIPDHITNKTSKVEVLLNYKSSISSHIVDQNSKII